MHYNYAHLYCVYIFCSLKKKKKRNARSAHKTRDPHFARNDVLRAMSVMRAMLPISAMRVNRVLRVYPSESRSSARC